ncbi:MAG: MarR family transcriptional regulator, partial [Nitrosopumilaceae archaeon]|nr:MarR family transcriptional regulator [Nitrosopumilaceae archaeon]NIU88677.1 MarR family transcriptional regulator [Nitrosopumilaceae archaeon]NIV66833.1 MarR family transcriptional regulator [Nitrosopumilaceae archaeon]NIX62805.1 MarR family transcriptional regulator [Nitrosopumilaceae archaeon]
TFDADPLEPASEIDLFGPNVDNFVAVGENGFLLSSEISGKKATIETFGSASFTVEYDIHDLISKEGRIWTFMIDAPSQYSLLMPQNSVIVGMSNLP